MQISSFEKPTAFLSSPRILDIASVVGLPSKDKYSLTVGIDNFDISPIEKSIDILLNCDIDYEFRTTIVKQFHTADDIQDIGVWIKGAKNYFLQNFVDSGDLICGDLSAVEKNDLYSMQQKLTDYVQNCEIRGI